MRNWRQYILAVISAGYLFCFLIVPVMMSIKSGFYEDGRLTCFWLGRVFSDLATREGFINALLVAATTTAGVFVLAVPLAVIADKYDFRGKRLASAMLMVPMILPPFVGALAVRKLLAYQSGSVNLILHAIGLPKIDFLGSGFGGVVILEILHLYPIMYLNALAALGNVDPAMIESARSFGASGWRIFRKITLPLIRPGIFAGGTIVFIWSFTELGTPLMVGYEQILPVQIFHGLNELDTSPKTFSMVFVMLSSAVGLYAIGKILFGKAAATSPRATAATARRAGTAMTMIIWFIFGLVTILAMMPHIGVVLMAFARRWSGTILPVSYTFEHFRGIFSQSITWNSIVNSLHYASLATVIDVIFGMIIAYLVIRAQIKGAMILDSLAMMPLAVPGLVIAAGYVAMTAGGLLASIGPRFDPTLIIILAYSVRRLPYVVRSISAGLQQSPVALEEAARNVGAGPMKTTLRITIPLISANILAGAILAFSFAMLEVSDSLILAQTPQFYPITKAIYTLAGPADTVNLAAALGTLGMMLLAGTLIIANLLLGKRLGAMFRV